MATIPINGPRNLTMQDFRAVSDMYGSLQKSCRFIVMIVPAGQFVAATGGFARDLLYLCEVAEFPGRTFETIDIRYYGPNHKLPYKTVYEDINLTFVCRNKSYERQFFDNWQLIMNPINTFDFNYRDQYRADVHVYQYDEYGTLADTAPTAQYWMTLHNAYPININSQPVTWADDQFQRLIVSFTYHHWSRPGIDPIPRTNAPGGFSFNLVEGRVNNR